MEPSPTWSRRRLLGPHHSARLCSSRGAVITDTWMPAPFARLEPRGGPARSQRERTGPFRVGSGLRVGARAEAEPSPLVLLQKTAKGPLKVRARLLERPPESRVRNKGNGETSKGSVAVGASGFKADSLVCSFALTIINTF